MNGRILVVDDDRNMCLMLESDLSRKGFTIKWSTSAKEALDRPANEEFDVVLTDLKMPGMDGIELCRKILQQRPNVLVVVFTAFGNFDTAVSAMRAGAYDFVTKPVDLDTLAHVLDRAVKHHALEEKVKMLSRAVEESKRFDELIGASSPMKRLYKLLEQVSKSDASVLISGESGTGKELVARSLHQNSKRNDGPFVAINCAAMPETLLESELFGHATGAFTDAKAARKGLFIQAHGGTLLLDEIADMPLSLQPKLLRALEQRTVRPVGGEKELFFDSRVIASTNRDLDSAVEEDRFREDLYYRINVIRIELPPLRARGNDILLLAQHFIHRFAASAEKTVTGVTPETSEMLLAYPWPGNVRELRNSIERAVTLTRFAKLIPEDLPEKIREYQPSRVYLSGDDPSELVPLEEVERRYILHTLKALNGNKTLAARSLGVDRKTLYRKLAKLGIEEPT